MNTYKSSRGIVGIRAWTTIPILGYLLVSAIPYVGTRRTGDSEKGFEDLAGQESILVIGGMIGHQVDYEMMSNWGHKSSKRLHQVDQ